ncbi:MAG: YbaK/prolyl-tRNA synthetase associated domain-containing protein [Campylobacter sp.]|nr:YbaK/prolyl-tRNA synthetase associated domain-containing protein [Campylobacter sp.]
MSEKIFSKIDELLSTHNASYRVLNHAPAGTSAEVAKIRGTKLGQGAKALVCTAKFDGRKTHILAVLPADHSADLTKLALNLGAKKISLASPKEVSELTDCVFGAIPPFSFDDGLELVVDPNLFGRFDEIAFNAGLLDRSIVLNADDYRQIVKPKLVSFAKV